MRRGHIRMHYGIDLLVLCPSDSLIISTPLTMCDNACAVTNKCVIKICRDIKEALAYRFPQYRKQGGQI